MFEIKFKDNTQRSLCVPHHQREKESWSLTWFIRNTEKRASAAWGPQVFSIYVLCAHARRWYYTFTKLYELMTFLACDQFHNEDAQQLPDRRAGAYFHKYRSWSFTIAIVVNCTYDSAQSPWMSGVRSRWSSLNLNQGNGIECLICTGHMACLLTAVAVCHLFLICTKQYAFTRTTHQLNYILWIETRDEIVVGISKCSRASYNKFKALRIELVNNTARYNIL